MDDATHTFQSQRRRLQGIAYRMLGSIAEAEEVVQDAWLRWHDADRSAIANAENNNNLSADSLRVKSAIIENGPVLKRFKAGARGTAKPRRKPMSHIRIVLSDGNSN